MCVDELSHQEYQPGRGLTGISLPTLLSACSACRNCRRCARPPPLNTDQGMWPSSDRREATPRGFCALVPHRCAQPAGPRPFGAVGLRAPGATAGRRPKGSALPGRGGSAQRAADAPGNCRGAGGVKPAVNPNRPVTVVRRSATPERVLVRDDRDGCCDSSWCPSSATMARSSSLSISASVERASRRSRAKAYRRSCSGEKLLTSIAATQIRRSSPAVASESTTASKSQLWTRRTRSWMSEPTF